MKAEKGKGRSHPKGAGTAKKEKRGPVLNATAQRKRWHALLDDILDRGDSDMLAAITSRLTIFSEMTTWPTHKPAPGGGHKRRGDAR